MTLFRTLMMAIVATVMIRGAAAQSDAPTFDIIGTLHFIFVEGSIAPRGSNQVEVSVTFRVENRGPRPVILAASSGNKFRAGDDDIPFSDFRGLHSCPDLSRCRRAQATTFAPGSSTTVTWSGVALRPRAGSDALQQLREIGSANVQFQFIRFLMPGDPDFRAPDPDFPRPPGYEPKYSHSMSFIHQHARMTNTLPGRS